MVSLLLISLKEGISVRFTKAVISFILTSSCLFQGCYAMIKSKPYQESTQTAVYYPSAIRELDPLCNSIIGDSETYSQKTLIEILSDVCYKTFEEIKKTLSDKRTPSDLIRILHLSGYAEIIEKINTIIFSIILKSENKNAEKESIAPPSVPSAKPQTKQLLDKAFFKVSSVLKKCENTFILELTYDLPNHKIIKDVYDKMCRTWDGLWVISESKDLK